VSRSRGERSVLADEFTRGLEYVSATHCFVAGQGKHTIKEFPANELHKKLKASAVGLSLDGDRIKLKSVMLFRKARDAERAAERLRECYIGFLEGRECFLGSRSDCSRCGTNCLLVCCSS